MENSAVKESIVICESSQGLELRGSLVRVRRHQAVFEICSPSSVLQTSEVLSNFRIVFREAVSYSGKAVIRNLVNTGQAMLCEVTLEDGWQDVEFISSTDQVSRLRQQFDAHISEWQKHYQILPEYKVHISDMQSFFAELRLWLDQVELGIRSTPSGDRIKLEEQIALELSGAILPCMDSLFEKFESVAERIEADARPQHASYVRKQLHPLLLEAPFAYRSFVKPLGYAGDYEMVNMILRNGLEGGSLFAKIVHYWFVKQAPAEAHRNRITHLIQKLAEETMRVLRANRQARIFSVACGPARELQDFLREQHMSNQVELTLLDFNEETLQHTNVQLEAVKGKHGRRTPVHLIKKSVQNILKESGKTVARPANVQYDFVYCAGLFDYLPDRICQRLLGVLYGWLAPGGLLLATNVDSYNPRRQTMEYVLDWNLNYRDSRLAGLLRPPEVAAECFCVKADSTGVNIMLEFRKPGHG